MRTSERLRGLRDWAKRELCDGREMKAPPSDMDITRFVTQEPRCYLGWAPTRPDQTGVVPADPSAVCPGILIMPSTSRAKYVEEKRFDRFASVHHIQELGQELSVSMLFSVYEPGVRLPGFVTMDASGRKSIDMTKIMEGTENGLFTLTNWMDDCVQKLLGQKFIPHTDLFLDEANLYYSLYAEQNYIVDKRPIFYGFVSASFKGYAEESNNEEINAYLK